jgi:hypothetical protein
MYGDITYSLSFLFVLVKQPKYIETITPKLRKTLAKICTLAFYRLFFIRYLRDKGESNIIGYYYVIV